MPNGGLPPCCLHCKWANKRPDYGASFVEPIKCGKHLVTIWAPNSHFCSDLSEEHLFGRRVFVNRPEVIGKLTESTIYAWVEFRSKKYLQYLHEFVPVASISTFSTWSLEEQKAEYKKVCAAKLKDLKEE